MLTILFAFGAMSFSQALYFYVTHTSKASEHVINALRALEIEYDPTRSNATHTSWITKGKLNLKIKHLLSLRFVSGVYAMIYADPWPGVQKKEPVDLKRHLIYGIDYANEIVAIMFHLNQYCNHSGGDYKETYLHILLDVVTNHPAWEKTAKEVKEQLAKHIVYQAKHSGNGQLRWKVNSAGMQDECTGMASVSVDFSELGIFAGVRIYGHEDLRPNIDCTRRFGSMASEVVRIADIHNGSIVLDLTAGLGDVVVDVLQETKGYKCYCIGMTQSFYDAKKAKAHVKKYKAANKMAKNGEFEILAVNLNRKFFNYYVADRIIASFDLSEEATKEDVEYFYDTFFTIVSNCRPNVVSVLITPNHRAHFEFIHAAVFFSKKYSFEIRKAEVVEEIHTSYVVYTCVTVVPPIEK